MTQINLSHQIHSCTRCPRLIAHCKVAGHKKRAAYLTQDYWAKPVAGFGDLKSELFIVGLAPGVHGANRTGRVFTGDQSGVWLYRALYKAGLSNQAHSSHIGDGLKLKNTYVSCIVKCAPPLNLPSVSETNRCLHFFKNELQLAIHLKIVVLLGHFAYKWFWQTQQEGKKMPKFEHGKIIKLSNGLTIILSYHPSQQNTFTGRLTEPMLDLIFTSAQKLL